MRGREKSANDPFKSATSGVKKWTSGSKSLWRWVPQRQPTAIRVWTITKVGLMVNHGAEHAIRKKARELLGDFMVEAA
jgi:hypothetical protein